MHTHIWCFVGAIPPRTARKREAIDPAHSVNA